MSLSDDIISGRYQYGQDVNPVKKRKQTLSEQIISGTYQYEEPTVEPTKPSIADNLMQFQDNFTRQSNILDVAKQEYQKALGEAYQRNNVNYDTRNLFQPREQFSRESRYIAEKPMLDNKPEDIKRALQEVEPQRQKANEELNKYLYAKYQKDQAEVENEDTTFYDKTLGNVVRGGQDLFSIFNTDKYRTEDGREITLPSRNELKQQKVSQDYDTTLGRIGGDVAYNVSKIATADLLNKATGGVGGSAIYWADMFGDNYKNAVNQGYDKENALVYSAVGTGAEFLTGKFLGSATKGLTGGKTSELSTAISNVANKLVKNKTVSNIIGNMGSEAAEEFVQEYIDNLNEIVTLEQSTNPKDYAKVFTSGENLENALYSAAVGALSGGLTNIGGSIQEARTPQISPIEEQNNLNNTITPQAQETSLGSLKTSALDYNIDTENGTINSVDKMMSDRGIKASFNADLFDNTNPTENEDIRYSKGTTYQDFVNKNFKSNGTGNKLKDIRKPKEQKKTMALVDAKPVAPKEKVAIVEAAKPVKETPKRVEAKKETKPVEVKPLLTKEEQQELNTLENIPFDLSTKEEQRLQYLKDKQAGVKIKHESLIEKQTYDTVKNEYRKYKNKMETFDNTALNKSKETISGNKQGRRTKEQWLDVAEHLGSNIKDMDSKDLEKYAIQSFIEARPNQKENLNRQGQKYVEFKLDDWLASVYKGAGVGEKYSIETKAPEVKEKQKPVEIAETKTEDLVIKAEEPKKVKAKPKPVDEKVAKILEERPVETKEEKGKIRKLLTTKILDKGYYVDKLARATKNKELSSKYDYMLMANGISQQMIGEKNFNPKTQKEVGKSLFKIFEPIENSGQLEKFSDYIYHKHNIDRMSLDTTFGEENKPVFGDTITKEKSQEIVNKYEKDNPEFKEWAKEVYEYNNNLLDILVDYGVISKADKEYYNNKYPNYVPIVRDNNNVKVNVEAFGKKAAVRNPIKKAKGGSQDIIPLKEAMSLRTMQTIKSALSNNFGTELYNILGGEIEGETANIDEAIENSTDERLTKSTKDKSATLSVFKDGKKVTFDIPDEIYEALAPSERYKIKGFNVFSNLRRSLTTEYNPAFMITNPVKDVQDGLLNSKHPTKFAKNIAEATMQIKKKGKYYQQYMANGGAYETYFNYDKGYNKAPEKSGKSFPRKVLNKIGEVNEAIELTPRLAEFISSIEAGDSVETAMYNAQEITTNFKRGGNWTKNIDANGATFLNAGVQGAVKQIRNIQEARTAGIKGMLSLAAKWTIAGTTPYLLSQLVFGDDDDYEDLSDYIKNNYYILWKNSDGNFIRIPKGRVMSVIQNAFEQPLKALKGRKINVKEFVDLLQNQILPNNPTESNIFSPLVDAAKNKTWYGGDLVSPRLQKLPEREQFDESTDSISKWIGKITGISPVKINYILDQYSGAIGDMVLPYLTLKAEGKSDNVFSGLLAPMRDKFTADSVMKNQNIRDFYDLDTEVTKKANSVKATDADILKSKYINGVKMEMSLIAKEQREIQLDRSLKNSEKYEQVRSKQREINRLAKTAIKEYESSTVKSNYGKINNVEYYKNNDNEWVKIPAKEVQKLDEQGLTIEERNTYFETKNKISEIRDNEDLDKEERRKQVSQAVSESDLTPDGKNFIYGKYYSNKDKDGIPLYDYYAEKVYNNR